MSERERQHTQKRTARDPFLTQNLLLTRSKQLTTPFFARQLHGLRQIHQGSKDMPKGKMLNNYRPTQQLYHRPLRTNIDFTNSRQLHCPSMAPQMYYTGESALSVLLGRGAGRNKATSGILGRKQAFGLIFFA